MNSLVGKVISQYEILELLGRGGMGVVYRAHDPQLDRDVAIKTMDVLMASDPNFLRRFQSEARALAKLNDPNIVSVFNLLETPDGICIVMELVRGRTLGEILKATPLLPVPRVVRIFRQVFAALDHAHREGVIHRDIKPANVMLTDADVVKVTDFGLAKIQSKGQTTVTKGTAGTLIYMSPEQIRGLGQVDRRGDVYSAGMALYECVAGGLPFKPDSSDYTIANMIVEGLIPSPVTINRSLPPELATIVMTAIDRDPAKRYQTAGEVLFALQRFAGASGAPELTMREPAPVPTAESARPTAPIGIVQRRPWRLIGALAGGAILLGILVFALLPSGPSPDGRGGRTAGRSAVQNPEGGSQAPAITAAPAQTPSRAAAPAEARLTLVAIPEGEVSVDDSAYRSAQPALSLGVQPGKRTVTFRGKRGGVKVRSVDLRAGESGTVKCYFQGLVHVEAMIDFIPSPLPIVVDGALRREKTSEKILLGAGKHTIRVRMEDYVSVPEEEIVTVEPSFEAPKEYRVTFRMKREQ